MKALILAGLSATILALTGCGDSNDSRETLDDTRAELLDFEAFARKAWSRDVNEAPLSVEDGIDLDASSDSSNANFDDMTGD